MQLRTTKSHFNVIVWVPHFAEVGHLEAKAVGGDRFAARVVAPDGREKSFLHCDTERMGHKNLTAQNRTVECSSGNSVCKEDAVAKAWQQLTAKGSQQLRI